jgi:hypothetical protein
MLHLTRHEDRHIDRRLRGEPIIWPYLRYGWPGRPGVVARSV